MLRILRTFVIALAIAQLHGQPIPKFEDFPAANWNGPNAPVKITTPFERMFRTRLREAAQEPPDFAGHYKFAQWGCGTSCLSGAILDLQTGNVFPPPSVRAGGGLCEGGINDLQYRRESRLVILSCRASEEAREKLDTYYMLWENNNFRGLLHTREPQNR